MARPSLNGAFVTPSGVMKGRYTIDYQDFAHEFQAGASEDSVSKVSSMPHAWGSYREKNTLLGPIKMYELRADLNGDLNILFNDERMSMTFISAQHSGEMLKERSAKEK